MLVVVAIIAILATLAIVSVKALTGGVQEGAARTALRSILASARADAAGRGHIVGVRFEQYRYPPLDYPIPANVRPPRQAEDGATFAVFVYPVRSHPEGALIADRLIRSVPPALQANVAAMIAGDMVFAAAVGRDPIRLPQGVELAVGLDPAAPPANNDAVLQPQNLLNATSFTILVAPNGQTAVKPVSVIARNNWDPVFYGPDFKKLYDEGQPGYVSSYDVPRPVDVAPMLLRDDRPFAPPAASIAPLSEMSVTQIWLYDQNARRQAGPSPWTNSLSQPGRAARLNINPYTGQLQPID